MLSIVIGAKPRHAGFALILTLMLALLGTDVAAGAKAKTHTIVIEALRYTPQTIEVAAGDTVVWINKDPFPHTVTAEDHSFDSGEIAADRSWKFKARKSGSFPYICTLHPTMKATLVAK